MSRSLNSKNSLPFESTLSFTSPHFSCLDSWDPLNPKPMVRKKNREFWRVLPVPIPSSPDSHIFSIISAVMVSTLFGRLPNPRPLSSLFLAARTDRDDSNRSDPVMLCAHPTSRRCLKIRKKSFQLLEVLITIFLNFSVLITIFLNFSGINYNFPGILKY